MSTKSSVDKRQPLSPKLSERLKPDKDHRHQNNLSTGNTRDHSNLSTGNRNDHADFHRRRHHRRANKRGRRHRPRDRSPLTNQPPHHHPINHPAISQQNPQRPPKNLVLRPTKGPLLNAPKNSTQFIIDDHETSPFLEDSSSSSPKKYKTRSRQASASSSRRVSISSSSESPQRSPEKATFAATSTPVTPQVTSTSSHATSSKENNEKDCQATPGNYVGNDDDYTLFAEFSERDFQSVYESAHQEEVADWDRHRLIEEITNLEKRQKELINVLAKVDPKMYAQRLEAQLQALQEKNRVLRSSNGLSSPRDEPNDGSDEDMDQSEEKNEATGPGLEQNNVKIKSKSPHESPDSSTKE